MEHGGVNIKEDNTLMEEDDPEAKNTIVDVGIGATNEDDEDDDSSACNDDDDDDEKLDIPIIEKAYELLY